MALERSFRGAGLAPLLILLAACGTTSNRPVRIEREAAAAPTGSAAADPGATSTAPAPLEAAPPATEPSAAPEEADPLLVRVGSRELRATDLLGRWLHRDPTSVRRFLEEMVLELLVTAEAERLGISVDPERLEGAFADAVAVMEEQTEAELDEFVRRRLGLEPQLYREALREELRLDLLAERCVRAWLLGSDRARARTLVVQDQVVVDAVMAGLARGEDFVDLARTYSLEPDQEEGPRVHHIVRGPSPMARLAFGTAVGEVGGPIPQSGRYLLLEVLEREDGTEGGWPVLRTTVEASLAERGIEDPEYWQWKEAMLDRYDVDMGPFLALLPEAAGD